MIEKLMDAAYGVYESAGAAQCALEDEVGLDWVTNGNEFVVADWATCDKLRAFGYWFVG